MKYTVTIYKPDGSEIKTVTAENQAAAKVKGRDLAEYGDDHHYAFLIQEAKEQ